MHNSRTLPCSGVSATLIALLFLAVPAPARADPAPAKPNVLFLLVDDQAWAGTSVAMHPDHTFSKSRLIETPHCERLAVEGMRFSSAYASAPMCAPTRAAFQTGRSPAALHWTRAGGSVRERDGFKLVGPVQNRTLATEETTIGELLRGAGYRTAHFGKWHLGSGGPGAHGYDAHDGETANEHAKKFKDPNPVDIFGMADRAIAFMKKSQAEKRPFFIQMSWNALHEPDNALAATKAKYAKKMRGGRERAANRAALAEDLDTGVGRLLAALDELGLTKDTFVIYTSDNGAGGGGRSASGRRGGRRAGGRGERLAGGKGSVLEGGIRVPLIVRGPGVAQGSWCHTPVTLIDFYPTCAAWAGVQELPRSIEGGSLTGLLAKTGKGSVTRSQPDLYFHFPHYEGSHKPHSAIRSGDWKLVLFHEDDRVALYDLSADILEQTDLRKEQPQRAADLRKRLLAWLKAVDAQMPSQNPSYDPEKEPQSRERRGGPGGQRRDR